MAKEILAYKCKKCGELHYPYRMVCKKCKCLEHDNFDAVALPTKGTLATFTELYTLPGDFNVATMGLGIVKLENGIGHHWPDQNQESENRYESGWQSRRSS